MYRSRKIEQCVLNLYKTLPPAFNRFPFDVKQAIAVFKNCIVYSYSEFADLSNCGINEVIAYCKSYTGCVIKEGDSDNFIILYNDAPYISKAGQAFILAHELGHILLGHMYILERFHIYNSNPPNERFEWESKYFAACLLCPMPVLSRLKPESALSIKSIFGLTDNIAEISFENYKNYDKYYNIAWHNDILNLFDFQFDLFYTYQLEYICEASKEIMPELKDGYPENISTYVPRPKWKWASSLEKTERCEITYSAGNSFEKLEDSWLYPEALGLS